MAEEFDLSKPVSEVSREEIGELMKTRKYAGTASERDPGVVEYVTRWFREKYPAPDADEEAKNQRKGKDNETQDNEDPMEAERKQAEEVLKAEWGDDYEDNVRLAQRAYTSVKQQFFDGDKELETLLEKHGNNPALVKLFHRIGKDLQKADAEE